MKFSKAWKGSVSIFLCLIMLPMVTYSTMIIDATRLQTSRSTIASAGDLAMNAALSEYEQTLEDMYGLFAVSKSPEDLKKHLGVYFTETIESRLFNGSKENTDINTEYIANSIVEAIFSETPTDELTNLINLNVDSFDYNTVPGSTLVNQAIMKKQIVEYMKYKGPVSLVNTLIPKIDFLKDSSKQTKVVQKKIEYTQTLNALQEVCEKAWKEIQGEKDNEGNEVDEGYNETVENFNKKYKNVNVNDYVDFAREYLVYVSQALLMNKTTHVVEKLPEWYELTSEDSVNTYKTEHGWEIDIPEWNDESTIEDLQNIMGYIIEKYKKYIAAAPENTDNFESNHLTIEFDGIERNEDETDDEYFSRIVNSIKVSSKTGDNTSIAYKSTLDKHSNAMTLDGTDFRTPEYLITLEAYYNNQNTAYDEAQLFKDDLKYIATSLVVSKQLSEAMKSVFNRYEKLVNDKIDAIEIEDEDEETNDSEDEDDSEDEEEETNEEKLEEEKNKVLELYHYYEYKYNKIIVEGVNSKFNSMGYNTSASTFLNKVNKTDLYLQAAKQYYTFATDKIRMYYQNLNYVVYRCKNVISALGEIEKKIENSNNKKKDWQGEINTLSASSTKSTMQSDLDTTTNGLNKEDVTALKKVVEQVKSDFEQRMEEVKKIKFLDVSLVSGNVDNFKDNEVFGSIENTIASTAQNIVTNNFKEVGFPEKALLAEILDGDPAKDADNKPIELFYTTLKSICEPLKTEIEEEQKNAVDVVNKTTEVNEDGTPKNEIPNSNQSSEDAGSSEENKPITEANGQTIGKIYEEIAKEAKVEKKADINDYKASGSKFSVDSDNYDDNANKATNSLSQATKILDIFSNIATNAINHAYLEEYFTEMFTCRTDPILAKKGNVTFLNGYTIGDGKKQINTNTAWYGNEIEYILWGNDDFSKNRAYTDSWIYVVRFALNAIYAFTAADIQSFALEIATAIAGWTVIGVPIVQACITVAIALAESAYDLKLLHDGKDVPIYKNASTFVCSPTGLTTKVVEDAAQKLIEKATEKVENTINSKIDEIANAGYKKAEDAMNKVNEVLNDYISKELETIESTITSQFVTPVINSVSNVFTDIDTAIDNATDLVNKNIKDAVDNAWKTIGNNIEDNMTDSLIKKYTLIIYEGIGTNQKDKLVQEIQGYFSNYVKELKNNNMPPNPATELRKLLTDKETGIIPGWFLSIKNSLKNQIEEQISPVKDEIKKLKDEEVGNIKSILNDKIDSVSSYIGDSANSVIESAMSNVSKPVSLSKSNKADTATSGGFTLNYKEYCKIMVFVKLMSSGTEGKMLNRAATLMQANVITAKNNANQNFKIKNAYTLIGVNATVEMGTLFPWAVEVSDTSDVDGNLGAKLDFNNLGDYKIKIKYNAVNGY